MLGVVSSSDTERRWVLYALTQYACAEADQLHVLSVNTDYKQAPSPSVIMDFTFQNTWISVIFIIIHLIEWTNTTRGSPSAVGESESSF